MKFKTNKTCEYQSEDSDDNLIENHHAECSCPPKITLMISGETMRCRKVRWFLWYHVLHNVLFPETLDMLLLFYPFRDEKELLSSFPPLYRNKLQQQGIQNIVNMNKIKFEPHGDLIDQAIHIAILKAIKYQW